MIGFNLPHNIDVNSLTDNEKMLYSNMLSMQEQMEYWMRNLEKNNFNETGLNEITEPIEKQISDVDGNVTEVALTALGLSISVSNLSGDVTAVAITVNGLSVADETGSYTIINGDKLVSKDHETGAATVIENGEIKVYANLDDFIWSGSIGYAYPGVFLIQNMSSSEPLKINGIGNMSIDASGKIYICTSATASGDVDIGKAGGAININGSSITINGNPYGAAVFT